MHAIHISRLALEFTFVRATAAVMTTMTVSVQPQTKWVTAILEEFIVSPAQYRRAPSTEPSDPGGNGRAKKSSACTYVKAAVTMAMPISPATMRRADSHATILSNRALALSFIWGDSFHRSIV